MRGDPFEHDGSELWHLRRAQRALLRSLPKEARDVVAAVEDPALPSEADPGIIELELRKTARRLLDGSNADALAALRRSAEVRLQWEFFCRNFRDNETAAMWAQVRSDDYDESVVKNVEDKAMKSFREELQTFLRYGLMFCELADRVAQDGYHDPTRPAPEGGPRPTEP